MPSRRGAEQVRRGGVWVGKRGPGGRGEMPPSARRRGGTVTATARAPAPRRSRLPGLAAHPRALPSAQARRWDLQQSLQETPGPVIRQEISALPDGQAGRVRVPAFSFSAVGVGAAVAEALKRPRLEGTKLPRPGLGICCAGGGAGGVRLPKPQPSPAAAPGPLPAQREPGCQRRRSRRFVWFNRLGHIDRCICIYMRVCIYLYICLYNFFASG